MNELIFCLSQFFFLKYANIPNCVVGFGTSNGILKLKKKKRKYNSGIAEAVE